MLSLRNLRDKESLHALVVHLNTIQQNLFVLLITLNLRRALWRLLYDKYCYLPGSGLLVSLSHYSPFYKNPVSSRIDAGLSSSLKGFLRHFVLGQMTMQVTLEICVLPEK